MSQTSINYQGIADAVWNAISQEPAGKLPLHELDAILKQQGLTTAGRGTVRRDTWNYQRHTHRKKFNQFLQAKHGMTLEVVSGSINTVYGLVPVGSRLIADPFRQIEKFLRRVRRPLAMIKQAFNETYPPPPGLDREGLERWHRNNTEFFEHIGMLLINFVEQNTANAGYASYIPKLADDTSQLQARGRARVRNRL